LSSLAANRDAGDMSTEAQTYWTPPTLGDTVNLEIEVPAGVSTEQVRISIPRLSHIFAKAQLESPKGLGDSSYCSLDITCTGTAYDQESGSVALLNFVKGGGSYVCTGTLMATLDNTFTPYMLTANHCFSTQTEASTLVSTFFFRSVAWHQDNRHRVCTAKQRSPCQCFVCRLDCGSPNGQCPSTRRSSSCG
jgi:lysyl endopeptidase